MALQPWEQLGSDIVFDDRWYRLRRDTVRLPSGRVVGDCKNTNAIVAFAGAGARRIAEPRTDDQEEIEVVLVPAGGLKDAIRDGELTSAGTVAAVYRALDS